MAFMTNSPTLNDKKFGQETQAARVEYGAKYSTFTVGGAITALGVLMVLLVGSAAFGWSMTDSPVPQINPATGQQVGGQPSIPGIVIVGVLVALVAGIATAFRPKLARITAPIYALGMGLFIGSLSAVYNHYYDGIVTQALFATLGIFVAMLFLYATRIIKVTNRFVMIVAGATLGICLMYVLAFVAQLFGAQLTFLNDGSPLAILISVGIIIVAALNLAINFAFIEKAAQNGSVPKYMEWFAAYGVMVTLVWIYLEVLRLLAMLNRR
jgi:uncharacterized YccA/Bax inhibitor family protein